MASNFHVCNPYCGKCKPPRPRPVACPSCGMLNDPYLGEVDFCKACGEALAPYVPPQPVFCRYIKAVCANPCLRAGTDTPRGVLRCIHHTSCDA